MLVPKCTCMCNVRVHEQCGIIWSSSYHPDTRREEVMLQGSGVAGVRVVPQIVGRKILMSSGRPLDPVSHVSVYSIWKHETHQSDLHRSCNANELQQQNLVCRNCSFYYFRRRSSSDWRELLLCVTIGICVTRWIKVYGSCCWLPPSNISLHSCSSETAKPCKLLG